MIQAGVLSEDDPVELLEGWIVPKMPRHPLHDATIDRAQETLRGKLPPNWRVRVQSAITTETSEPEPDISLVPGPAERYRLHHPRPEEVAAAIEVADTSLAHDRDIKGRLYARARIPIYWIINLADQRVEVYTEPTGPDAAPCYQRREDYGLDAAVPLILAGQPIGEVAVRELFLPPAP
jgi:hypothetical protein